jgi:hypothetical protein
MRKTLAVYQNVKPLMQLFSRVTIALLFLSATPLVKAQFEYTNINGSITITRYDGPGGIVAIPAVINGLPVTGLAYPGFLADLTVTSVSIPASVTNIQAGAFEYCFGLTEITVDPASPSYSSVAGVLFDATQATLLQFPGGVTGDYTIPDSVTSVGDYAFYGNLLSDIDISLNVTNVGQAAFSFCPFLDQINVDPLNQSFSSADGVLFDYLQQTLIQYPGGLAGPYAVPSGVITIDNYAFQSTYQLTGVSLPASVVNLGSQTFSSCDNLLAVNVDPANLFFSSVSGVLFDLAQDTLLYFPSGLTGGYAIPNGTITIGPNAFDYAGISSVGVPASVASLGSQPFFDCKSLLAISVDPGNVFYSSLNGVLFDKNQDALILYPNALPGSYTIPNGVATIGSLAFLYSQVATVTAPASVTSLLNQSFSYCGSLASITFLGNAPAIDPTAFVGDPDLTLIYLPGSTGWTSPLAGVPALLWNAAFQASSVSPAVVNQQFGFYVTGTPSLDVVVQGCTNLASPVWLPLQTLNLTNGSAYFSQPVNAAASGAFFRLSTP